MTHDSMCCHVVNGHPDDCFKCEVRGCECALIARVRADEAPKAVARWVEQGAASDDWMKVWQVREYAEELEATARADERQRIIGVMERNADGDAMKVIDAVLDML